MKTHLYPSTAFGILCSLTPLLGGVSSNLSWRSEAINGNWSESTNWWDGTTTATPPGFDVLTFDNDAWTVMVNDALSTTRSQILFAAGATVPRTIDGVTPNTFATGAVTPLIENGSPADHTINFPITLGPEPLEVRAISGGLTLGGTIDGTGNLVVQGPQSLVLSGSNSFAGSIAVSGGTLSIDSDDSLGAAPGVFTPSQLTMDASTLEVTAAMTMNGNRGFSISGGVTVDSSVLGTGGTADVILASEIAGAGGLVINGHGNTSDTGGGSAAEFRITGVNTFTGDVTINSGMVSWNDDTAFGDAANDIVIAGGGLLATGNRSLPATRGIVLSGGGNKIFRSYGSATLTIDGAVSGDGNVRHTDGGTLVLNGANSFLGNIDNVRGNLTLGSSGHTGNVVNSSGVLALAAGNTYSGYTFITGGTTLRLDADDALPDGTDVLFYGGTTFNVNDRADTLGGLLVGSGADTNVTVDLGTSGALTVTDNAMPGGSPTNAGSNFYAKISGAGSITYDHATAIANLAHWDWLNPDNDFLGDVTIRKGRLRVVNDAALGDPLNDLVFDGEVVATLGNQQGTASIQVTNGTSLPLGPDRDIVLNAGKEGTMYVWGGTTMTIDGKVTGGGNLRKEDGGTLLLNNPANDWSGEMKLVVGAVSLGASGALSPASSPVVAGGTLNLNGFDQSVTGLSGGGNNGGVINGGATLTVTGSGSNDYTGVVVTSTVAYAGTGSLTLSGNQDNAGGRAVVNSGTLVLAKDSTAAVHAVGANNEIGLTINGGTARLDGTGGDQVYTETVVHMTGGTFDLNERSEGFRGLTGTSGVITNNGSSFSILEVGQTSGAGDVYSFAGSITDGSAAVDLTKTGDGTLELTGASTYTGFTTVTAGTLAVQGSLGNTATAVSGNLAGNGAIAGNVDLLAGGTLGARITDWTGAPGAGFDQLALGVLNIAAGGHAILLDTSGLLNFTEAAATFPVIIAGGITGFNPSEFAVITTGFPGGGTWAVQQNVNALELVYTAGSDPYGAWATAKGLTPANNGPTQDPDADGLNNLGEFGFDGDPLSPASDGKIVGTPADPDGGGGESEALTITLPVRLGAVFNGPGDLVSDAVDDLIYRIQGSSDLVDFTSMDITEITGAEALAIQAALSLPPLSDIDGDEAADWEYRTFRTPGEVGSTNSPDFLRGAVEEAP